MISKAEWSVDGGKVKWSVYSDKVVNWLPDGGRVDWSTGADHSDRGGVGRGVAGGACRV